MRTLIIFQLLFIPLFLFSQQYREVDAHARSVKFTKDYKAAVQKLTSKYDTDELKARAIFSWLATHIEYDKKQLRKFDDNKKEKVQFKTKEEFERYRAERIRLKMETALKKRKGVCQDYSWLFQGMLAEVGIECEFITGHARNNPMLLGRVPKVPSHAWNAAKIDGEWHLFDLTWSTEMFENNSNGFFMLSPDEFLKSHYPSDKQWQLLEEPISIESWSDKIYWYKAYPTFHKVAVKVDGENHDHMIVPAGKVLTIDIDLPQDGKVFLIKPNSERRVELKRSGNEFTVDLAKSKTKGRTSVCVLVGTRIQPLMEFKIE